MAAIAITRNDMTAAELRAASGKAKDGASARRMLAIALVLEGIDRRRAAQSCGMDRQTLRDWMHRYNAEGLAGLVNRKAPGRRRYLDDRQRSELARLVEAGPEPDKEGVVRWRRIDLKRKIEDIFSVQMHERTVGKPLTELGFAKIIVRPQHPKADVDAQEAFKKTSRGG